MPQPNHVMAIHVPDDSDLEPNLNDRMRKYFSICREKIGFVPNVLKSYAVRPEKIANFVNFYNELMLGESGLSKLEREMIAVVVSSTNHCYYCIVAHGQAVRELSGDSELGEMLAANYRVADLEPRHMAMLDFVYKLTNTPEQISDSDRQSLREAGFTDHEMFDIADVAGFFNMSNRVAIAMDMMPNREYQSLNR